MFGCLSEQQTHRWINFRTDEIMSSTSSITLANRFSPTFKTSISVSTISYIVNFELQFIQTVISHSSDTVNHNVSRQMLSFWSRALSGEVHSPLLNLLQLQWEDPLGLKWRQRLIPLQGKSRADYLEPAAAADSPEEETDQERRHTCENWDTWWVFSC